MQRARDWRVGPISPDRTGEQTSRFEANGVELYPQTYWPMQTLTVHHTATANDDPDPAAPVRAIYAHHLAPEQDFGDIGFHLLIDELGRVYEGRYSGDDLFPARDPTGSLMVNAGTSADSTLATSVLSCSATSPIASRPKPPPAR